MSKNHIKIFDDTVLKQSINQGTEAQRMATNLGRFTSGELAYTRDTGRLFIGTKSSKSLNEIEMPEILGGILAGNKYLGFIDSKPLAWWKGGEYSSLPLNYDSETIYGSNEDGPSKETYTKESSMLREDSKYRNKLGKDGKRYEGKWERDAVYNKTYDAYNGDYLYDIYQNALILFDTNISENRNSVQGTVERPGSDARYEQYFDNNGNELPIDEQYKRTKISNINTEYHRDHPVYGDGYVIFRNIEVDGKSIKFKDKMFNSDGTSSPDAKIDGYQNQSHNIIEVGSISASSMIDAMSPKQFHIKNEFVHLKDIVEDVKGFANSDNSFKLPQNVTFASNSTNVPVTLNFDKTGSTPITELVENDLTLKLVKTSTETQTYRVDIAKSASKDLFIKLGDGLYNAGPGSSDYIKLNQETAGVLSENIPTISLSKTKNFYDNDNDLTDPFYTQYKSDSGNLYFGTLTVSQSGAIQNVERYEEDYKKETVLERSKFDDEDNIKNNLLKNPIPIMWNSNSKKVVAEDVEEGENTEEENGVEVSSIDAKLEYIIKPNFYCITKEVKKNGQTLTGTDYDNSVVVLGNNYHESLEKDGTYFIIPGYNVAYDIDINDRVKGDKLLKCNFEAFSENLNTNDAIHSGVKKIEKKFNENGEEVGDDAEEFITEECRVVYNKSILSEDDSRFDENYFRYTADRFINGEETISVETTKISDLSQDKINEYFCYRNFNSMPSLIDFTIEIETDENGNQTIDEIYEDTSRNTSILPVTENIKAVRLNGFSGESAQYAADENETNGFRTILSNTHITRCIEKLETVISDAKALTTDIEKFDESRYAYYDCFTESEEGVIENADCTYLVWTKVVNDTSSSSSLTYKASLYHNADAILNEGNLSTTINFITEDDVTGKDNHHFVNITEEMPFYKSFTIYKKIFVNEEDSSHSVYFTTSDDDSLTNEIKRYLAVVQIKNNDGTISTYTPSQFWNICVENTDLNEEISSETSEVAHLDFNDIYNGFGLGDKENGVRSINLINATEKWIEVDKITESIEGITTSKLVKYYDIDGNRVYEKIAKNVEDETLIEIPATQVLSTKYDVDSFVMAPVYWSDKGYHTPLVYQNAVIEGVEGEVELDERISEESPAYVVIPDHANEVILEVRHKTESNSPIAIFTAKNKNLLKDTNGGDFDFGFNVGNTYVQNGDSYQIGLPSIIEDDNSMTPNENEKCVLYSDSNTVTTIKLPLYRSDYENGKMFAIRVAGLKQSSTEKMMIRLIGYSL